MRQHQLTSDCWSAVWPAARGTFPCCGAHKLGKRVKAKMAKTMITTQSEKVISKPPRCMMMIDDVCLQEWKMPLDILKRKLNHDRIATDFPSG